MRTMLTMTALVVLAGCSHADRSATVPRAQASHVAWVAEDSQLAGAATAAGDFCRYYHAAASQAAREGAAATFACVLPKEPIW